MVGLKTLLFGTENRIVRRLIVLIVAFSSMITLLISTAQLAFEYVELRDGVGRVLDGVGIFVPSVAESVWHLDETQMQLALNALTQLPNVDRVTIGIVSASGEDQHRTAGRGSSAYTVTRIYPLRQRVRDTDTEIGTLTVVASLDAVYRLVAKRAVTIVASNGLKTFLVALFMALLFRRVVTTRLERLAHKVSALGAQPSPSNDSTPSRPDHAVHRPRPPPPHLDELDAIDWTLDETAEELRRAEQGIRLAATAFEAHVGIVITDADGAIVRVNRSFTELTGYGPADAVGRTLRLLESDRHDARFYAEVRDRIRRTGSWSGEIWSRRKSGEDFPAWLTITAVEGSGGEITHHVGTAMDLSQRKAAEDELRMAHDEIARLNQSLEARVKERTAQLEAANADLEAFGYSVSHDMRAPLRAIDGFSALIERHHAQGLDETGRRLLQTVRTSAQRMGQLIDDILAFSRAGRYELHLKRMDMAHLVREAWQDLEPQRQGREVELRLGELPPAVGDPAAIHQVWQNLLANAIKFTRGRPRAVVEAEGEASEAGSSYWVKDNGVGFDPAQAGKLFGMFQRLHGPEFEGTGAGLTIVKRFVAKHGGRVWAEGRPGEGARFCFSLPEVEGRERAHVPSPEALAERR